VVERNGPERPIVFFSVRDGWAPLCEALGKDVPDIPFPKINNGEAIDKFSRMTLKCGLMRRLIIFVTLGVAVIPYFYM